MTAHVVAVHRNNGPTIVAAQGRRTSTATLIRAINIRKKSRIFRLQFGTKIDALKQTLFEVPPHFVAAIEDAPLNHFVIRTLASSSVSCRHWVETAQITWVTVKRRRQEGMQFIGLLRRLAVVSVLSEADIQAKSVRLIANFALERHRSCGVADFECSFTTASEEACPVTLKFFRKHSIKLIDDRAATDDVLQFWNTKDVTLNPSNVVAEINGHIRTPSVLA